MKFSEGLIEIFVPIYLYQLGYSIQKIILYYFLVSLYFVLFSVWGAKIVSKIGAKHSILLSTPFLALYYLGLNFISYSNIIFIILPLILSLRTILYNYGFHLNYIEHSNASTRGKELSSLGILTNISTAIAPILAGFIIIYYGFNVLFVIGFFILLLSTLPLFMTKDIHKEIKISSKSIFKYVTKKENRPRILSFSGYAIESIIERTIWPIFLLLILVATEKVGALIGFTLLISIITFYYIGGKTDQQTKSKLIKSGTFLYFISWIGKILAHNPFGVFVADLYKNITQKLLYTPWSAKSYNMALKEKYFNFIVTREIIFNLSRVIVLPIIMIIFYIDFLPFVSTFLIAAISTLLYPLLSK